MIVSINQHLNVEATRRRSIAAVLFVATLLAAAACGSSAKKTNSTGLDATRQAIATYTIAQAKAKGFDLDTVCVDKLVRELSDADAATLAGVEGKATSSTVSLSPAGQALGTQLQGCVGSTASVAPTTVVAADPTLVKAAVDKVFSTDDSAMLDRDCVTKNLSALSKEQLQLIVGSAPGSTDPKLAALAPYFADCFNRDVVSSIANAAATTTP